MALGCTCLPIPGGIYLWEGFWNGFLFGQIYEILAIARGNYFRIILCLDSLDIFICCTGIRLLIEEQEMAEIILADLIIPEICVFVTIIIFNWGKILSINLSFTSPIGPFRSEILS